MQDHVTHDDGEIVISPEEASKMMESLTRPPRVSKRLRDALVGNRECDTAK